MYAFGYTTTQNSITCCKGCKGRYLGCHDKCQTYIEAKQKFEETKKQIRDQKRFEDKLIVDKVNAAGKRRKRKTKGQV